MTTHRDDNPRPPTSRPSPHGEGDRGEGIALPTDVHDGPDMPKASGGPSEPQVGPELADNNLQMTAAPAPAFATVELFERAVRAHSARLLAIARAIVGNRASPEDVVQQAVLNLFKHRERYDWREPGGLLKRATVNEALRLLRQPKMSMVPDEIETDRIATPDDVAITDETVQKVRGAIALLPEHFRAALVLCEYENMSYAQIAETLNASVPQVKTWIHRARRKIEKQLSGYVGADPEPEENE